MAQQGPIAEETGFDQELSAKNEAVQMIENRLPMNELGCLFQLLLRGTIAPPGNYCLTECRKFTHMGGMEIHFRTRRLVRLISNIGALAAAFPSIAQDLKPRLTQEDLEKRLTQLLQVERRPTFEDFRKVAQPGGGLLVTSVKEDSIADKAGLMDGDILTSLANRPLWSTRIVKNIPLKQGNKVSQWFSHVDRRVKTAEISGPGFRYFDYFRPENIYANEGNSHSPEWNELMTAGLGQLTKDPDFAESALAEAIRLGYPPTELTDFSEAVLAAVKGDARRLATARDRFYSRFPEGTLVPPSFNSGLEPLLVASHGLKELKRWAFEQGPGAPLGLDQLEILSAWSSADGFDKHGLTPAQRAEQMEKIDLRPRWSPITDPMISMEMPEAPFLVKDKFESLAKPGHYEMYFLGTPEDQPVKNIAVRFEFTAALTGLDKTFSNTLDVSLVNRNHGIDTAPSNPLRLMSPFLSQTVVNFEHSQYPSGIRGFQMVTSGGFEVNFHSRLVVVPVGESMIRKPADSLDVLKLENSDWFAQTGLDWHADKHSVLELIRVDGGAQILIDGATVLHMPVDPAINDVVFSLKVVGMHLKIYSFQAWELKPRPG